MAGAGAELPAPEEAHRRRDVSNARCAACQFPCLHSATSTRAVCHGCVLGQLLPSCRCWLSLITPTPPPRLACREWVDISKAKTIATKLVNFLMTGHPEGHETEEGERRTLGQPLGC